MFRIYATSADRILMALLAASAAIAPIHRVRADTHPAVQNEWKLGAVGGWDYLTLDPSGALLYITPATRVDVLDTHAGSMVGSIDNTNGVYGVRRENPRR